MPDPVAQLVEHLPFKPVVRGSSPRWVTIMNEGRLLQHSFWNAVKVGPRFMFEQIVRQWIAALFCQDAKLDIGTANR